MAGIYATFHPYLVVTVSELKPIDPQISQCSTKHLSATVINTCTLIGAYAIADPRTGSYSFTEGERKTID